MKRVSDNRLLRWVWLGFLGCIFPMASTGCIERWLLVRTDPPKARVFLDSVEIPEGQRIPFQHYGVREVLVRFDDTDGATTSHSSVAREVELEAPWYQWFPIDFFVEHLWPWTVVDEHTITIHLEQENVEQLFEEIEAAAGVHGMDLGGS